MRNAKKTGVSYRADDLAGAVDDGDCFTYRRHYERIWLS